MRERRGALAFSFLIAACTPGPSATVKPASATADLRLPPLEGLWLSDGYGAVFEVAPSGELRRSQVTTISCIPVWHASVVARDAASVTYQREGSPPFLLHVRPDASPHRIRVQYDGAASEFVARRLPAKLPVCEHSTPDTPLSNFDVFAATWAENYPFFALTKTDWPSVVASARAKVTTQTTPEELFGILEGMIAPLHDAHSSLAAPKLNGEGREWGGFQDRPGAIDPKDFDRAQALVNKYVVGPLRKYCEGQIEAGMIGSDLGFVRINGFVGYHADGSFESGERALEAALDAIFADTRAWRGLVVDVRINGGGYDPYGLAIASRLTATEYVAYEKQARNDPVDPDHWTAAQASVVKPSARPGFRGRVVELTGPNSISAAETFTQSLMQRTPAIARVGQTTQGVFSDVMSRALPNGWIVGLPNERYVSNGKSYDHIGIPPTVAVPLYAQSDVAAGRDVALEEAIRILRTP